MTDYKDLEIRAAAELHDDCFSLFATYAKDSTKAVLDVAAGAGAFAMRLADAGFDVTANDIDEAPWEPTQIRKLTCDLNKSCDDAFETESMDAVVAMEIIEHVQNPTRLLEDCARVVKPEGFVLLSTPNVLDMQSRIIFLRSGFVFHTSPHSYEATGHCQIMPDWLLETFIRNAGLEIVEKKWSGSVPEFKENSAIKRVFMKVLQGIVRAIAKPRDEEELSANNIVYILRRK